jgi:endoglucanase Acf2
MLNLVTILICTVTWHICCGKENPLSSKDPAADLQVSSFQRSSSDSGVPTKFWAPSLTGPLPTNAWYFNIFLQFDCNAMYLTNVALQYNRWMNFVLPNGEDNNNNVFVFPHIYIARSNGLNVINPWVETTATQVQSSFDPTVEPIVLGSSSITNTPHVVSAFDDLSTTLSWAENKMYAPIVRGMAFTTMVYNGEVTASVSSVQIAKVVRADGNAIDCSSTNFTTVASEIEVSFVQSDATYIVFYERPTAVLCSASSASFKLESASQYVGALRIALSNNCTYGFNTHHCPQDNLSSQTGVNQSAFASLLRENYATYPVGGEIAYVVDDAKNAATLTFEYQTKTMNENVNKRGISGASAGQLLSFTMPHHRNYLIDSSAVVSEIASHHTIRGVAKPYLGATWTFTESLTPLQFEASKPVSPEKLQLIIDSIKTDADYDLPLNYQLGAGKINCLGTLLDLFYTVVD